MALSAVMVIGLLLTTKITFPDKLPSKLSLLTVKLTSVVPASVLLASVSKVTILPSGSKASNSSTV